MGAAELTRELPRLAKAVKEAMGAKYANICTVDGDKGQVNHANFHIVAEGAKKLSDDAAKELLGKIDAALHPPKPLKKPRFGRVGKIQPEDAGLNLSVKAMTDPAEKEVKNGKVYEVQVGDASGVVTVSLAEDQKGLIQKGKTYELRNAATKMVKGHVMVFVDKWGKIEASETDISDVKTDKDVSAVEFEQVKA